MLGIKVGASDGVLLDLIGSILGTEVGATDGAL
jgi:hypothetical protein